MYTSNAERLIYVQMYTVYTWEASGDNDASPLIFLPKKC